MGRENKAVLAQTRESIETILESGIQEHNSSTNVYLEITTMESGDKLKATD